MSKKDIRANRYMSDARRYADFFNGYLYRGKQVIDWTKLEEVDTKSLVEIPLKKGSNVKTLQRFRDLLKSTVVMKDEKAYYMLLGIENQTRVHYAMPVRNMLYNALAYQKQVEQIASEKDTSSQTAAEFLSGIDKNDKLIPVITVTLYWGTDPWDGPVCLKQMLYEYDSQLDPYIDDCNINLFSIIDDSNYDVYQTELKELFHLLRLRNDMYALQELLKTDQNYEHINKETAEMMQEYANIKLPRKSKEGDYNMCKAIADLKELYEGIGREQGMEQGREQGLEQVASNMLQMHMPKEQIEKCTGLSLEKLAELAEQLGVSLV